MCMAAFPPAAALLCEGKRTEPQKHPEPQGCETGQEIVLFFAELTVKLQKNTWLLGSQYSDISTS